MPYLISRNSGRVTTISSIKHDSSIISKKKAGIYFLPGRAGSGNRFFSPSWTATMISNLKTSSISFSAEQISTKNPLREKTGT